MKILIGHRGLNVIGGSETFTYTLVKALLELGEEVDIFTLGTGPVFHRMQNDLGIKQVTSGVYDIVFASQSSTIQNIINANITSPLVQVCHGTKNSLENPHSGADKHISISKEVKLYVESKGYESELIYNPIDTDRFKPMRDLNPNIKRVLDLTHHAKTSEIIQTIAKRKGWEVLRLDKYGKWKWNVEDYINRADLVFSLGRGTAESLACGRPVFVWDKRYGAEFPYGDGVLDKSNIHSSLEYNFSGRKFKKKFSEDNIIKEIEQKYDPNLQNFYIDFIRDNMDSKTIALEYANWRT